MITSYIVGYETSYDKTGQMGYYETIIKARTVQEVKDIFYSTYNKKNVRIVRIAHKITKEHKHKEIIGRF